MTVNRASKIAKLILVAPAWAAVLAGCGGNREPSGQGDSPSSSSAAALPAAPVAASAAATAPSAKPSSIRFADVTSQSGIDMVMTCGDPNTPPEKSEVLEVNGGGLGLIDFDNDGDLDLFVVNGATMDDTEHGPGCRLYENLGNLKFRDVTAKAGIDIHRWAMGVAVGDYDGDGFDDIYVCCYGPSILLRNTGDGRFVDVTKGAGVGSTGWSTSAAFGDVDGDGDLDLYVCRYLEFDVDHRPPRVMFKGVSVMAGPQGLRAEQDSLYENRGDGTFLDITASAGCMPKNAAYGLNVVILDFDRDGKQDIVVSNDSMANFFFHNIGPVEGHPRFEEIGTPSGIAANADGSYQASMGIAIADVDGNGFPDKFTTVFSSDTNALHMNTGGRLFEDRAQQYGLAMISRPYLGWSCGFFDFDHDGDEDLFMVNGHVYPQATMASMDSDYRQNPLLFERAGKRFNRITPEAGGAWLGEKHLDRNAVFADLDNDGDIDIIIGERNGPIRIMRNDIISSSPQTPMQNPPGDWLIVELKDDRQSTKNHRGLGSRIELIAHTPQGDARQTRWLFTGGGFQSSGAPYVHFGLPATTPPSTVDLNIVWPDGLQQPLKNVALRQHVLVRRQAH